MVPAIGKTLPHVVQSLGVPQMRSIFVLFCFHKRNWLTVTVCTTRNQTHRNSLGELFVSVDFETATTLAFLDYS